jgi:hypothetical protein
MQKKLTILAFDTVNRCTLRISRLHTGLSWIAIGDRSLIVLLQLLNKPSPGGSHIGFDSRGAAI